jgi:hypothetical protein
MWQSSFYSIGTGIGKFAETALFKCCHPLTLREKSIEILVTSMFALVLQKFWKKKTPWNVSCSPT